MSVEGVKPRLLTQRRVCIRALTGSDERSLLSGVKNMRIAADTHIHSRFSFDSDELPENIVKQALEAGLSALCITDHMNINPAQPQYMRKINEPEYRAEVERLREAYSGRITILRGIEYDNPQAYPEELGEFQQNGYDMIIGSVHGSLEGYAADPEQLKLHSAREIAESYLDYCLAATQVRGYDVFGHFGLPWKILKDAFDYTKKRTEVLRLLAERDIPLEINTNTLRGVGGTTLATMQDIREYERLGGRRVTFGSDAHRCADVACGYALLESESLGGLTPGVFIKRRFVPYEDL